MGDDEALTDGVAADPFAEPKPDEPQLSPAEVPATEETRVEAAEEPTNDLPPDGLRDDLTDDLPEAATDRRPVAAAMGVPEPLRLWTDASGQRAIVGTLAMLQDDAVVIRKAGGHMVTVALEQLSDVDRLHAQAVGPRLAAGLAGGNSPAARVLTASR
jgi:hypothetical protein